MISDRILEALRAIISTEIEPLRYAAQFDYNITAIHGVKPDQTFDLAAVDPSLGLPNLTNVPIDREVAGITGLPEVGFDARVIFLNRDPARPRVIGWDNIGDIPIARVGDRCSISFPQQITVLSGAGGPTLHGVFTGTVLLPSPNINGYITMGSEVEFSG